MSSRDMLLQHLRHMRHKLIHIIVRFIDIIIDIIPLPHIIDQELHESNHIAHISHRLAVLPLADHQELTRRNLLQQIVNISTVPFAENHRRPDDIDIPVGMRLIPTLEHLLRLPLRLPVMIEWIRRMVLIRILLIKAINSHRREKDNSPAAIALHSAQRHLHAPHICIIIKRHRRHIVAMLRRKENHHVRALELAIHLLLVTHIADHRQLIEKMARQQIHILAAIPLRLLAQQTEQPRPDEPARANHNYLHISISIANSTFKITKGFHNTHPSPDAILLGFHLF